jgi:ATP-dependent DNA ligase
MTDSNVVVKVFDILYLKLKSKDFGSLLMRRLSVRRRMLMQILTFSKGLVEMPESRRGTTKADINNYLTEIVATWFVPHSPSLLSI